MTKKIDTLHPLLKSKYLKLKFLAMERFGHHIGMTQALRTEAVQYAYWCKGRFELAEVNAAMKAAGLYYITEKENRIVTKAKSVATSFHGYGMAFDIVIIDSDGKTWVWDNGADTNEDSITDWDQVGSLADECGLEWGGNFTSISDKPHFQDRMGWTIAKLREHNIPSGIVFAEAGTLLKEA